MPLNNSSADDFFENLCSSVDRSQFRRATVGKEFWRKEDPILDKEGKVLKGGMWEHQRDWWNLPNFVRVMVGGLGAGKSLIGSKRIISLALDNAPCPVATVSPNFGTARRTLIPTIQELLQRKQAEYGQAFWWRYNSAVHEFKIRYHGRNALIQVLSGDRPLSLRGPNLAAAYLDEPFIQEFEVYQQMVARVRHPDATTRCILLTGTPEGITDWGYELCFGKYRKAADLGIINASTRANKALPQNYVANLETVYTAKAAEAFIEGKFVNLSDGLVYYAFDPIEHVVDQAMPVDAELGAGMDFNVNPMACTVFWRVGSHVHILKTYELRNADTEYLCQVLREEWWAKGLRDIYPDASGRTRSTKAPGGKSDFHFIREAGFTIRCRDENPKRRDRYNAVNSKFKPRTGRVSLTINPQCESLIRALSTYSHELMDKQESMSHICFAGDTLVDLGGRSSRIDQLPATGSVRTWDGSVVSYVNAGMTRQLADLVAVRLDSGEVVRCTPDHLWLTDLGWVQAKDLLYRKVVTWKSSPSQLPARSSTRRGSTATMGGTLESRIASEPSTCIGLSGSSFMEPSRLGMSSTTRITTDRTTASRISNLSRLESTLVGTPGSLSEFASSSRGLLQPDRGRPSSGTNLVWDEPGIGSTSITTMAGGFARDASCERVSPVVETTSRGGEILNSAPALVLLPIVEGRDWTMPPSAASSVEFSSPRTSTRSPGSVREVVAVVPAPPEPVYCLTVPSSGCFVLECGAVVSNCDSFSYPIAYLFPRDRDTIRMQALQGT